MSSENLETRERILRACWRLLEENPGSAVRMSDIAKAAGISRQALYLHFPARADLLVATARYLDGVLNVDERLTASRTASSGRARLDAYIEAWGNYIPQIYGVSRAFMAMEHTDEAAAAAWADRMQAMRHGCAAAIDALVQDGDLKPGLEAEKATDLLWTLLSVRNWEH
ncbi:MAG: TetR/AcrR family transcriptional regulator, partial [Pseudomonadota bacterium]|nr:TetR/AcrR family transcriptional regulator [Pseudomonadota bacterium]